MTRKIQLITCDHDNFLISFRALIQKNQKRKLITVKNQGFYSAEKATTVVKIVNLTYAS